MNALDRLSDLSCHHSLCMGCKHMTTWFERHPFGSTVAIEEMAECSVQDLDDCPLFLKLSHEDTTDQPAQWQQNRPAHA